LPFIYEWRRGSIPAISNEVNARLHWVTLQAPTNITPVATPQQYRIIIRNLASPGTTVNFPFTVAGVADSDVDGIPDSWETANGFNPANSADRDLDADGDGLSNYQEYLAGTNPTNALSQLSATITDTGVNAAISFSALSNKTYTLQYSETPGGIWSSLGDVFSRASNRVEVISDPVNNTNRFYRVVTPRQP
jgi:hypothetical protein